MEEIGVRVGRFNTLQVVKLVDFGVYLDGGSDGEILLPRRYVPEGTRVEDELSVFIYLDSEDRLIATTDVPLAQVGQVAFLECRAVSSPGAFLDWGLPKDLLVPRSEQRDLMRAGQRYVVFIFEDLATGRIAASQKMERFLNNIRPRYKDGEAVDGIVIDATPLGYKFAIADQHTGIVYRNEVFENLQIGDRRKVYVKRIREDEKIDLSLSPLGYDKVDGLASTIIDALKKNDGRLNVCDKTDPEQIKSLFGCSKKSFKMAIGALYKEGKIELADRYITLK